MVTVLSLYNYYIQFYHFYKWTNSHLFQIGGLLVGSCFPKVVTQVLECQDTGEMFARASGSNSSRNVQQVLL